MDIHIYGVQCTFNIILLYISTVFVCSWYNKKKIAYNTCTYVCTCILVYIHTQIINIPYELTKQ